MNDDAVLDYGDIRVDLSHVHPSTRAPMLTGARAWIAQGQRPPLLSVKAGGVEVSTRPDLWPGLAKNYRSLGRLEWVGTATDAR